MRHSYFIVLITLVSCSFSAQAQDKQPAPVYDFLPREKVLFADNFLTDTIGDFPAKWRMSKCVGSGKNDSAGQKMVRVQEDSLENVLVIAPYSSPHIEQNLNATHNVNDIFTLEFDYQIGPQDGYVVVDFQIAEQLASCYSVHFLANQIGMVHYTTMYPKISDVTAHYPGFFDPYSYHHLAVSYFRGAISYYIDQHKVVSLPLTRFTPIKFGLNFRGPAKIKNFRLATGVEVNEFNKLLSARRLMTHNILFYDTKATTKSISVRYLLQLAMFLKLNPSINLEIDVHSDNAGGEEEVIKHLSVARAEELKHQLVMAGIDAKRLTAKGFGDTVPLKPNTTPEGMAANRRVEFVVAEPKPAAPPKPATEAK